MSSPTWFGRLLLTPHREPEPRRQCRDCAGGGDVNGLLCGRCDGRGWHDAQNPDRGT